MATRATLIFNPSSGRGRRKEKRLVFVLERLERLGIEAEPAPTRSPHHGTELAREALKRDKELVIAWGGDGTLNEVARGMVGSCVPLGVLPGGTVNVFARETGVPSRLEKACEVLARGESRLIPIGMAGGRPFLSMAGIGLDAEVVYRLKPGFKKKLGVLAFWLDGFRLLATYPFLPFTVRVEGQEYRATSVVVGKVRRYGSGYVITPEARLEEPLLDVVMFQGRKGMDYLRYLVGVLGRFHLRFKDVVHLKAFRLEVHSSEPLHYQLDGEPAGTAPLNLEVLPRALSVVLPRRQRLR